MSLLGLGFITCAMRTEIAWSLVSASARAKPGMQAHNTTALNSQRTLDMDLPPRLGLSDRWALIYRIVKGVSKDGRSAGRGCHLHISREGFVICLNRLTSLASFFQSRDDQIQILFYVSHFLLSRKTYPSKVWNNSVIILRVSPLLKH